MVANLEKFKKYRQTKTIIIFNTVEEFRLFNPYLRFYSNTKFDEGNFLHFRSNDKTGVGVALEYRDESWQKLSYFTKDDLFKNFKFINIKDFIIDSIIEIW